MIKRVLSWILGILILLGLLYAYVSFGSKRARINQAQEILDASMPNIANEWDWGIFASYSEISLTSKNDGTLEIFAEIADSAGPIKKYVRSKYKGTILQKIGRFSKEALVFNVNMECENGPVSLDVSMTASGSMWKISGLVIQELPKSRAR